MGVGAGVTYLKYLVGADITYFKYYLVGAGATYLKYLVGPGVTFYFAVLIIFIFVYDICKLFKLHF